MTPDELRFHYHDRYQRSGAVSCRCMECAPDDPVTHREMAARLAEIRAPGPSTYDPERGHGEDPSEG